jgi:hypothetical protein
MIARNDVNTEVAGRDFVLRIRGPTDRRMSGNTHPAANKDIDLSRIRISKMSCPSLAIQRIDIFVDLLNSDGRTLLGNCPLA